MEEMILILMRRDGLTREEVQKMIDDIFKISESDVVLLRDKQVKDLYVDLKPEMVWHKIEGREAWESNTCCMYSFMIWFHENQYHVQNLDLDSTWRKPYDTLEEAKEAVQEWYSAWKQQMFGKVVI